jgi:hypothetical protein
MRGLERIVAGINAARHGASAAEVLGKDLSRFSTEAIAIIMPMPTPVIRGISGHRRPFDSQPANPSA